MDGEQKRDLALPPGMFAHMQDLTKGTVTTVVGPTMINQSAQDQPVVYDDAERRFRKTSLEGACRQVVRAELGEYVVLHNPTADGEYPPEGKLGVATPTLFFGQRANIPGPTRFALFPEQIAKVIPGHELKSNQYVLIKVLDGQTAQNNWEESIFETTDDTEKATPTGTIKKEELITGSLHIIKGTEVKFFIPCTGIEVVPNGTEFVRDAMSLERLEFCILIDESGQKRYEKGQAIVFPQPTERFWKDGDGNKKFRAYELNEISGLHLKVIADYEDALGKHKAGDELFITGRECPIFYPRAELSIIKYGDKDQHFATAVPEGEGKYVMDRLTGVIRTVKGPEMLMCDPRQDVIVRRVLSDKQCELWYPGNVPVANHNQALRMASTTSRRGYVEEEQLTSGGITMPDNYSDSGDMLEATAVTRGLKMSLASPRYRAAQPQMADEMRRRQQYTEPRALTLDTKMDGAVAVTVWSGYAVLVSPKTGPQIPIIGPAAHLLDYSDELEVLRLSTGKPKNTDTLYETVYLRVQNNKVSDIVDVQTKDHVTVSVKLSLRVNFVTPEGENVTEDEKLAAQRSWFSVDNYVKLLCDHVRSMLKGAVRRMPIQEFYGDTIGIIRDTLLGKADAESGRAGLYFPDNNMKVIDVDVLKVEITDHTIGNDLSRAQHDALTTAIRLDVEEQKLVARKRTEQIAQETLKAVAETKTLELDLERNENNARSLVRQLISELAETEAALQLKASEAKEAVHDLTHRAAEARRVSVEHADNLLQGEEQALRLKQIEADTMAVKERLSALKDTKFVEALEALQDKTIAARVAEHMSGYALLTGCRDLPSAVRHALGGMGDKLGSLFNTVENEVEAIVD